MIATQKPSRISGMLQVLIGILQVKHPRPKRGMNSPVMLGLAVEYLALTSHIAELVPTAMHGGHAKAP